ncbi:ribonuclease P protein component [Litoribrevibacter albus]|uniref:Ribonuclease P protein component n=1 Tax=Litoribrevibacter albus TaxID=1473156 RepID=A0AA37SEH6_9GAMM|nr:ribonuclease P protein component [Litoribrevibacter albus]GLQ32912.1 ribonuclease P protein component [Litoribrevibacter albus]
MSGYSYPKQLRLLTGRDYNQVFSHSQFKVSGPLGVFIATPNSLSHPRLGFVIAKKKVKLAVDRNRIKRVMRDNYRLNQHKLPSVDIVFIARPGLGTKENLAITKFCNYAWHKLSEQHKKALKSDKHD